LYFPRVRGRGVAATVQILSVARPKRVSLAFTIPGAPVPCARVRVFADKRTGHIRAARPGKTAAYERHVATCAQIAVNLARWQCVEADYGVELLVYRAARRGDWDNFAKAVDDGMNGIVFPDDRMIVRGTVEMSLDRQRPRIEVVVHRWGPE
jgi:crossover junction endodeoxyribonuclease RusA